MRTFAMLIALACLIPASASAQDAAPQVVAPAASEATPPRFWIVAGAGFGTLRGFCQDCEQDFPFRHGGAVTGDFGYRVNSRTDIGADVFWMQWHNESGRIRATAIDAVGQFRPWESQGFFVKGGAGMAFVRNWVHTIGPHPDNQKALSVVFGGGWAFSPQGRYGLQLFATQHVGAIGDLQTANGPVADVTGNFWTVGAAIVLRR